MIPMAQSLQASINTEYGTPPTSEFSAPLRVVILMLVPNDAVEIGRRRNQLCHVQLLGPTTSAPPDSNTAESVESMQDPPCQYPP
jgi:hypothetical protein